MTALHLEMAIQELFLKFYELSGGLPLMRESCTAHSHFTDHTPCFILLCLFLSRPSFMCAPLDCGSQGGFLPSALSSFIVMAFAAKRLRGREGGGFPQNFCVVPKTKLGNYHSKGNTATSRVYT